jgi:hypothetical protein
MNDDSGALLVTLYEKKIVGPTMSSWPSVVLAVPKGPSCAGLHPWTDFHGGVESTHQNAFA